MPRDRDEPLVAKVSIILLLANGFLWAGLRSLDMVLLTFLSTLVALGGMLAGRVANQKVQRHSGRIPGEAMAQIGYWSNLVLFILMALWFAYVLAMGILAGDFL